MQKNTQNIPFKRLVISNIDDINFKDILIDYKNIFDGHHVKVETNYNLLSSFIISFNLNDLPHLMGWNKLSRRRATQIIKDVNELKLTKQSSRSNHNWHQVSQRMLSYNFLTRIFLDQDIKVCILTRDMKPNRLKLDIVFTYPRTKDCIVFGLRKPKNRDEFIPTTLHIEPLNNPYKYRRKTTVKKIEWLD